MLTGSPIARLRRSRTIRSSTRRAFFYEKNEYFELYKRAMPYIDEEEVENEAP